MLRLWLPLNGDLHNQGLDNVTVNNSGATVDNNGKIGKCYSFATSGSHILIPYETLKQIGGSSTVSFWANIRSFNTSYATIFSATTGSYSWLGEVFTFQRNGTSSAYTFHISDGVQNHTDAYCVTKTLSTGVWYHFALVADSENSVIKIYQDGSEVGSHNTSVIPGWTKVTDCRIGKSANGYQGDFLMNDFRIYDRVLSPKEIKELSKGLVLHYPLSEGNMIDKSNVTHGYYLNSSGGTTAVNEWCYTDYIPVCPSSNYLCTGLSAGGSGTYVVLYDGSKTKTRTLLLTANTDLNITTSSTEKYIRLSIREIANELNTTAQFVCLDSTVYDVSGFQRNGSRYGTTLSSDTARYNLSTSFDGADDEVIISNLDISTILNNQCTIAFWIKPNSENGYRSIYFSAYSSVSWSIEKTTGNKLRLFWNANPDIGTNLTITDGEWQHIAITKNGTSDVKVYLNGTLIQSLTNTHNNLTFGKTWRLGRDIRANDNTPYKGLMSDFRLYATALSADDILALYHTPTSIANNGTLLTQGEISEV